MAGNKNSNNGLLQITKALDFRSTKRITVRVALGESSSEEWGERGGERVGGGAAELEETAG